jgi:hypothetical protein
LQTQAIPLGATDPAAAGQKPEKARKTVKTTLWISA